MTKGFSKVGCRVEKERTRFPSRALAAQSLIAIRRIDRVLGSERCPCNWQEADALYALRDRLQTLCNGYPVRLRQRKIETADRLKTMFSGALFTSNAFPWPLDGEGNPFEPICQVELDALSSLAAVPIGEGLLQVWAKAATIEHCVRVVPPHCVVLDKLTPPIVYPAWPGPIGNYDWRRGSEFDHAYVLDKILNPFLDFRNGLEGALEDAPTIQFHGLQRSISSLASMIRRGAALKRSEINFFGSFDAIQYPQSERGQVLVSVEPGMFMFGDHGNAQVFYAFDKHGMASFFFDWSCP